MTVKEILDYLDIVIASFDHDPPDSPYQDGYLAAAQEIKDAIAAKMGSEAQHGETQ